MTITKRINREKIEEVIARGGHVTCDNKKIDNEWKQVLIRVPLEMVQEIDLIIKQKRKGMTRNAWIVESIQDKLTKLDENDT